MKNINTQILDHLETILLIAIRKGDQIRNPWRYSIDSDPISTSVGLVCHQLDELACPWLIQNLALNYINNADTSKVWDELHSRQLNCIAKDIYAKGLQGFLNTNS